MSRAKWKGPFLDKHIPCKSDTLHPLKKIWSRRSVITSFFIGKSVLIHTGNSFKKILITREKVGYKFGEFCLTRIFRKKTIKKLKK